MTSIVQTILIGIGATLSMDIYALILKIFGIKSLDYRFVGRWMGYFPKGKFFHHKIMDSPPVMYEQIMGWMAHYFIGIAFAFLLVLVYGEKWLDTPTIIPAMIVGIFTVAAPFFVMQPAFGFGIAGSNLPNPNTIRFMSLITHSVFGAGLYLSAVVLNQLVRNI